MKINAIHVGKNIFRFGFLPICIALLLLYMYWRPSESSKAYRATYFGESLPNLSSDDLNLFDSGFQVFIKVWTPKEGLGPLLNSQSCANCHHIPVVGGIETSLDRFVINAKDYDNISGGHSFPRFRLHDGLIVQRHPPTQAILRKPQALYGLGLLESIPISRLRQLADENDTNKDGVSGRLPLLPGGSGRFGWKSQAASIEQFVSLAFNIEMGLTNELYRNDSSGNVYKMEVTQKEIADLSTFIRLLAAPPKHKNSERGKKIFTRIGCSSCHVENHITYNKTIKALDNVNIAPYTDMLLHDMGHVLGDGIAEGNATENEFRTSPLWGINSLGPPFMHDGRANSIAASIMSHGGEADHVVNNFKTLSEVDQESLIDFVRSL